MTIMPHNTETQIQPNYNGVRFNKKDLQLVQEETADTTGKNGYPPLKNKKQILRYELIRTLVVAIVNLMMVGLLYAFCVASHVGSGEANSDTVYAAVFFIIGFYIFLYFPARMGASEKYYKHLAKYYEIVEAEEEEARRQQQRQQQMAEFQRRQNNIGNVQYYF